MSKEVGELWGVDDDGEAVPLTDCDIAIVTYETLMNELRKVARYSVVLSILHLTTPTWNYILLHDTVGRQCILESLISDVLAWHCHTSHGRPTKQIFSKGLELCQRLVPSTSLFQWYMWLKSMSRNNTIVMN